MHPPIILFDFDGVILTQKALELAGLIFLRNDFYKWRNAEKLRPIDLALLFEKSDSERFVKFYKNIHKNYKTYIPSRTRRDLFLARFGKKYRKLEKLHAKLKPGICNVLMELRSKEIPLGIISNTQKKRMNYFKKRFELDKYFTIILSRNDLPYHKPNPYPIIKALKYIKEERNYNKIEKSDVYFIGDIPSDIICAKSAGIKSIAVLSGHGTKNELLNEDPDYVVERIIDILELPPFKKFLFY